MACVAISQKNKFCREDQEAVRFTIQFRLFLSPETENGKLSAGYLLAYFPGQIDFCPRLER
jgi:hypothetical protein